MKKYIIIACTGILLSGCFVFSYPQLKADYESLTVQHEIVLSNLTKAKKKAIALARENKKVQGLYADMRLQSDQMKADFEVAKNKVNDQLDQREVELGDQISAMKRNSRADNQQIKKLLEDLSLQEKASLELGLRLDQLQADYQTALDQGAKSGSEAQAYRKRYEDAQMNAQNQMLQVDELSTQLVTLQKKEKKALSDLNAAKKSAATLKNKLAELEKNKPLLNDVKLSPADIKKALSSTLAKKGVEWKDNKTVGRLILSGKLVYQSGSASITEQAFPLLQKIGNAAARFQKEYIIAIEGHTDSQPLINAPFPSNWELSAQRATNVSKYMINNSALKSAGTVAVGCSSNFPRSKSFEKNRRVEIVFIPKALYTGKSSGGQ